VVPKLAHVDGVHASSVSRVIQVAPECCELKPALLPARRHCYGDGNPNSCCPHLRLPFAEPGFSD
jgi:hypothetical protein